MYWSAISSIRASTNARSTPSAVVSVPAFSLAAVNVPGTVSAPKFSDIIASPKLTALSIPPNNAFPLHLDWAWTASNSNTRSAPSSSILVLSAVVFKPFWPRVFSSEARVRILCSNFTSLFIISMACITSVAFCIPILMLANALFMLFAMIVEEGRSPAVTPVRPVASRSILLATLLEFVSKAA